MEKVFNKGKNKKKFFSIICATFGKESKINKLCHSLSKQKYKNFELIICDQNNHNFNKDVIKKFHNINIKFLKTKIGLSNSRNIGIKNSIGNYLIFLDDDIELNNNYLKKINTAYQNTKCEILCYKVQSKNKKNLLNYPSADCCIETTQQIFNNISSVSFVIKNNNKLLFDKKLGLGSNNIYQSGEETDFILRAVKLFKYKILFLKSIHISHIDIKNSFFKLIKKNFLYGCGWSYVVKKHKLNIFFTFKNLIKILLNIFYHILCLNLSKAALSISTLLGRLYALQK